MSSSHHSKKVPNQEIELKEVHTEDQVTDIFTKPLAKPQLEIFTTTLGVIDPKYALRWHITN